MKARMLIAVAVLLVAQASLPVAVHAATITVTGTADGGPGSLRDALASAANGDTIDASGVSGTILLTNGELLVTNSVDIVGAGPERIAINGNRHGRIFVVGTNNSVSISGLALTNGGCYDCLGGGIWNQHATLTISNCVLSGNASGGGGAIFNDGEFGYTALVVVNTTISNNVGASEGFAGGAILNWALFGQASVRIVGSTLSGNGSSDGGAILNSAYEGTASVEIVGCTLSNNVADGSGGGVMNSVRFGSATVIITNSMFYGNSSTSGGGVCNDGLDGSASMDITTSILSSNSATGEYGSGGGIANLGGATLAASSCIINGNSAVYDGGIYNRGTMQIAGTTVSGNTAYEVGGIFNFEGIVQISNSTISSNAPGGGWNRGVMQIVNSTLSGNSNLYSGGAMLNDGSLQVANCTVSGNSAQTGGGICNFDGGTLEIGNTVLMAGAAGSNIQNLAVLGLANGTIISLGYNLSSDDGGGFLTATGDQINTNPLLGPLQDNGGPTFTCALLPGSPAINAGDPNFTPPPYFDQRGPGFPRVVCGRIDIGAFEVQDTPIITCPANIVTDATSPKGAVVYFTPTAVDECSSVSISSTPASGSLFAIGDTTVSCIATNVTGNEATCSFTVHVKGAAEQINNLIALVQALNLKPWTAYLLTAELQAASNALRRDYTRAACIDLDAFIFEVDVQTWWGQIWPPSRARLLIRNAQRIQNVLGCYDEFGPGHF